MAELGNTVTCVDLNKKKIASLNKGVLSIYERGLDEIFHRNRREGRLFFTADSKQPIESAEVIINAVDTPSGKNGRCDLSSVKEAAKTIGKYLNGYKVIVNKSTVPVGTGEMVEEIIKFVSGDRHEFDVASNPEFLKEGQAVNDFLNPDRIVVGVESDRAGHILQRMYFPIVRTGRPIIITTRRTAEVVKYAANCFLATKISFINEMANYCEKIGVDVQDVEKGVGTDNRIGPRFLHAGIGFGGSCFPKDVDALIEHAKDHGHEFTIIKAAKEVNKYQRGTVMKKLKKIYPKLKDKEIAIWGISFKPKTDDIRQAPAVDVIKELLKGGAKVRVFDPAALKNLQEVFSKKEIKYCKNPYTALKGADALLVLTEWDEFRNPDFEKIKKAMKKPVIIDGRNIYDPKEIRELGFDYIGVGR